MNRIYTVREGQPDLQRVEVNRLNLEDPDHGE
jgi:hypothetical protein